ncbi:MAG: hypothetical protein QNJ90_12275 [Planctomycetota bacterium]|nr:hypothetical protein [Planctomycetota bacterium]
MLLLALHAAATWALVGLIWTIQLVHYPLMDGVGRERFDAYHKRHTLAITWIVGPLMLTELLTAVPLAIAPPQGVSAWSAWAGLALIAVTWMVTAFVSVPQHQRLEAGFEADAHRRLVRTNWIRTAAWTARGFLTLAMLLHHGASLQTSAPSGLVL